MVLACDLFPVQSRHLRHDGSDGNGSRNNYSRELLVVLFADNIDDIASVLNQWYRTGSGGAGTMMISLVAVAKAVVRKSL